MSAIDQSLLNLVNKKSVNELDLYYEAFPRKFQELEKITLDLFNTSEFWLKKHPVFALKVSAVVSGPIREKIIPKLTKILKETGIITTSEPYIKEALATMVNTADENALIQLVNAGLKPDSLINRGRKPVHLIQIAAKEGLNRLLKVLVEKGANINIQDKFGATPLHIAAQYGKVETALKLLKLGANPLIFDYAGNTALHLTIEEDMIKLSSGLIYMSPPELLFQKNYNDQTPIEIALDNGYCWALDDMEGRVCEDPALLAKLFAEYAKNNFPFLSARVEIWIPQIDKDQFFSAISESYILMEKLCSGETPLFKTLLSLPEYKFETLSDPLKLAFFPALPSDLMKKAVKNLPKMKEKAIEWEFSKIPPKYLVTLAQSKSTLEQLETFSTLQKKVVFSAWSRERFVGFLQTVKFKEQVELLSLATTEQKIAFAPKIPKMRPSQNLLIWHNKIATTFIEEGKELFRSKDVRRIAQLRNALVREASLMSTILERWKGLFSYLIEVYSDITTPEVSIPQLMQPLYQMYLEIQSRIREVKRLYFHELPYSLKEKEEVSDIFSDPITQEEMKEPVICLSGHIMDMTTLQKNGWVNPFTREKIAPQFLILSLTKRDVAKIKEGKLTAGDLKGVKTREGFVERLLKLNLI